MTVLLYMMIGWEPLLFGLCGSFGRSFYLYGSFFHFGNGELLRECRTGLRELRLLQERAATGWVRSWVASLRRGHSVYRENGEYYQAGNQCPCGFFKESCWSDGRPLQRRHRRTATIDRRPWISG